MIHACTWCLVFSAKRSLLQACDRSSRVRSHGSGTKAPWKSGAIRPNVVDGQATSPLRAPSHVPTDLLYGGPQVLLICALLAMLRGGSQKSVRKPPDRTVCAQWSELGL